MPPHPPTTLLRAAVRPRMLMILVVLLAAAAVCARLGAWQLERAQLRAEQTAAGSDQLAAAPVPLQEVIAPQTSFTAELVGRPVTVAGTYDAAGQLLVRDRTLDGRDGFLVLTPLRVAAGGAPAGRAVLPVVRGWVASADGAGAVPAGEVRLTGYLQASEAAGALDAAAREVDSISSAQLVNEWGGPIYSGYLVVAEAAPAQDPGIALLPPPQPRGGGWDLRNLGYAVQWWIFGLFAVVLWLRLVRDEAHGEPAPGEVPASGEEPSPGERPAAEGPTADASAVQGRAADAPAVRRTGGDAAP